MKLHSRNYPTENYDLTLIYNHPTNSIATRDVIDNFHSASNFSKYRVAAIEVWLGRMRHEPLRPARVFARQSHADRRAIVGNFVDLATDLVTGPTVSVPARIAGLDHKVWHDARNCLAIEVTLPGKLNKIVDRQRRIFRKKFDCERTFAGHHGRRRVFTNARDYPAIISFRVARFHIADPARKVADAIYLQQRDCFPTNQMV